MKIAKKLLKATRIFSAFILFSIFASQCFSQSNSSSSDIDSAKQRQFLKVIDQLYYFIQQNYVEEVDPQILYEGALKGMLGALDDPYSVYMAQSEWRSLTDTTVGNFGGVGLSITKPLVSTEEKPAYVEVAEPIENTPGAKAGIQSGDLIVAVDGVDTSTITMDEVLSMLRGAVGESVTVKIRRRNTLEFERTLVRAVIQNPSVKYGMIEGEKIGYLRLTEFSVNTAAKVQEALDSFKEASFNGLVIDLRNNGGGLLDSAVDIADKFIDEGIIVSTKSRLAYENAVYHAVKRKTVVRGIPIVVLINRATASASEILSGALKDTKTAYLVGEKSFGKGSVQVPRGLVNNDGFKITVAKYYSPSDTNIDKIGIKPDLEVLYPDFTEEEQNDWHALEESGAIADYVDSHQNMTEAEIASYAKTLQTKYKLEERLLRKMIRNELDRTRSPRLYDLDYDSQLKAAIEVIKGGNFAELMASTKTLKEQQEQ
ncbi:S41 family peptidase [uncultured Treponema sp.]|uniref:S41 family peptidase n=1 Tax=uncultured Treponema sp. TaxID=162155 RepID=UPI002804D518|nr:S41 family peptidase [uncultured Treponema sp.]